MPDWASKEKLTDRTDKSLDGQLIVRQALDGLAETERKTLWLAYVEGWSWREVAGHARLPRGQHSSSGCSREAQVSRVAGFGSRTGLK